MEKKASRFVLFLIFNFLALWIGTMLMKNGPQDPWYLALEKAPWTPAGWVFGAAWTSIMVAFSFYMMQLSFQFKWLNTKLILLYGFQWVLNVAWNYAFFNQQETSIGLIVIIALWLLVGFFTFNYLKRLRYQTLLIAPYLIWLTIATSLNVYIVLYN